MQKPILSPEQEVRVKKLRLLVSQEQFKNELLQLVEYAKFEFKQGDRTVKDIKKEVMDRAKEIINKYVVDTYLYGKLDAVYSRGIKKGESVQVDLSLKKEDLEPIAKLKKKFVRDFRKIINDMIKAKERGEL